MYLAIEGIIRKLYVCVLKFLKVPAVVRAILYIPRVREKNYILETLSVNRFEKTVQDIILFYLPHHDCC
jgi:hypothetical protein